MAGGKIKYQPYVDYVQSANTLFHFMNRFGYLTTILFNRAIVPRYCVETMDYLNIECGGVDFSEVAVLQKCFCDIPLHKIADTFSVTGTGDGFERLSPEEKFQIEHNNTHFDLYGKFAIGFSKDWSERNRLQPIHYLNTDSSYSSHFQQVLSQALNADDLPDSFAEDVLYRLAFIKPLRGVMQRSIERTKGNFVTVDIYKNFHDECEWRFVPDHSAAARLRLENVTANPRIVGDKDHMKAINQSLEGERYNALWLRFDYDDIRYLIVPDAHHRIKLIQAISDIPDDMFSPEVDTHLKKQILISKILVLDEIRKDW